MQDGTTLCKEEIRDISHLVYGFEEAKKSSPELTKDKLKELIEHNKNLDKK